MARSTDETAEQVGTGIGEKSLKDIVWCASVILLQRETGADVSRFRDGPDVTIDGVPTWTCQGRI